MQTQTMTLCYLLVLTSLSSVFGQLCTPECTKNGVCRYEDEINHTNDGPPPDTYCDCNVGFVGQSCEYECKLACFNGGVCRPLTDMVHNEIQISVTEECNCPDGWLGIHCEVPYVTCPDDHKCLHGSTCIKDPNAPGGDRAHRYTCDCSTAHKDGVAFAGKDCRHKSERFCATGDKGGPVNYNSFCANGGTCSKKTADGSVHMGCDCIDGWWGDYCEQEPGTQPKAEEPAPNELEAEPSSSGGGSSKMSGGAVFGVVLVSVIGVLGLSIWARRKLSRRDERDLPPVVSMGDDELSGTSAPTTEASVPADDKEVI